MEDAVRRGDLEMVQESIWVSSDGSDWQKDLSLLILAVEKSYEDIALVLLAEQSLHVEDLCAALDVARDMGLQKVAEEVIDQLMSSFQDGAICKGLSQEQKNRLFQLACRRGDEFAIRKLLQSDCDVSILSREEQEELLHRAFDKSDRFVGDMFVIEALLQNVAVSVLSREKQEWLLFHACHEGGLVAVDTLITNGCNVNCSIKKEGWSHSNAKCTPLMIAAREGHKEIVKKLILAGAKVGKQDSAGFTALHHAAIRDRIPCGILLAEGGASVRTKDSLSRTALDMALSAVFVEVIEEAISFTTRKTLCIIGNGESGKSTLVAALQAERKSFIGKRLNRFRRVDDRRERTAGIETISHGSQKYGEVLFFDFAGQHEYHGPHQVFLESLLGKPGVSTTLLLVVKATEEEEAILHQLHRWLSPVALMADAASPPQVIVIGSFLDKVKSKQEATAKLTRCIEMTRKDLEELPLEFVGSCFLNCRQPQSEGMDQLCRFLEDVPVPEFRATHTQYSLAWVLSQIRSTQMAQAVQLQEFSKWIEDNKHNLPQTMPPPEEVCQDLSAAGHALYIPNKKEPLKSWLVLDLPGILHDVYGTLFSQFEEITNEFGLLQCRHLASLFPGLDVELVQQLLLSLEFCIPVDPSVLKVEMRKLTQSEETSGWLFFPALITTKPPPHFPEVPTKQSVHYLCWQLRTSKKHSVSAHVLQTILLRLVAHFVVQQHNEEGIQHHCCSIWWNGIAWQSVGGINVSVHITTNRVIQVVGTTDMLADKLYQYLSDVISDILSTVHQLSPNLSAAAYIVHPSEIASLYVDAIISPPQELFPIEGIRNAIAGDKDSTVSCKDIFGLSTELPVPDLFGGWTPSQEDIERILWTQPGPSQPQSPGELSNMLAEIPTSLPSTPTTAFHRSLSIPFGAQALLDTSSVPSLSDVNELIVTQVAGKWQELARTLGMKDSLIDTVSKNYPKSCTDACEDMLQRWLNEKHTGKQEQTWSTLLTALGRADFGELERSLRREHFHEKM